jgi:pimeloyl-ACP methyl ester carboxylesterase
MKVVGIAALLVLAPIAAFVLTTPPTASGAAYMLGLLALAASPLLRGGRRRGLAAAAGCLIAVTVCIRLFAVKGRWVDRVIAERDLTVSGARLLRWTPFGTDPDAAALPGVMREAYREMDGEGVVLASPVISTLLGLEDRETSETLEVHASNRDAVVFLHGYGGNYAMSCWLIARAARRAHMTTVCPSTRWRADWWSEDGEAIVKGTLASLRARGFEHVVLAGLSNGAVGASRLAPRMSGLSGLLLVSGAASDAPAANIPVLVVQGTADRQMPDSLARGYAERTNGAYVALDAGHFALLVERDRASDVIAQWLSTVPTVTDGGSDVGAD